MDGEKETSREEQERVSMRRFKIPELKAGGRCPGRTVRKQNVNEFGQCRSKVITL